MPFIKPTTTIATMLLAAVLAPTAAAQPSTAQPTVPAPSAWTVAPDPARGLVQIGSTATNGPTTFVGGCNKLAGPGLIGRFSRYTGDGLRRDGAPERVLFYVQGGGWQDAFAAQLRYQASSGSWEIVSPLAPVFVNSFSRGGTLAVRNGRLETLFTFDLTGSTAAARAMRSTCGFP